MDDHGSQYDGDAQQNDTIETVEEFVDMITTLVHFFDRANEVDTTDHQIGDTEENKDDTHPGETFPHG